ncbi:hypothetical protein B0T25DRAFT_540881 [Lasiosphaeria hispida]|uniref:Myb/SANT-like domain-containing protein n=1 Tax=Lasiosphaeria hispida TaxID=260671 RepID=A0AAJ0HNX8_9PEZI|nr:hypothetical protein B0T25DRAFT_540881 [Lasiosphaeria hispida]
MPWTAGTISSKYDTERGRYRLWKTLLEYSGVAYDEELNLPTASESVWETFMPGITPRHGLQSGFEQNLSAI